MIESSRGRVGNLAEGVLVSALGRPAATAVVDEGGTLTYAELDRESAAFRDALIRAGVGAGDRVCLLLPKSRGAIVAILGILRAGGVYVPMDPDGPAVRTAKMVSRSDTPWLVAGTGTGARAAEIAGIVPSLHLLWYSSDPAPSGFRRADVVPVDGGTGDGDPSRDRRVGPEDPAYILFTSGSTGEPKGVVIGHGNVLTFLEWAIPYFGIQEGDRISGHPPLHFDLSVFDTFGALSAGATLHLVPPRVNLLPHKLADWISESRLTQWFSVPGVLTHLARYELVSPERFGSLRRVLWCGEVLPTPTLVHWMRALPGVRFTNLYGPTEATIASSYFTVSEIPSDPTESIPIGRACPGEELVILDAELRAVPRGRIGELWIGGAGLSAGYWRDPARTAVAFQVDPRRADGARLYRTGDLASVGPDGMIRFHGREDTQIKSRGYRIELGEVEAAILALASLREAAVVAIETGGLEGTAICCAYVPERHADVAPGQLRMGLSQSLPAYMVPRLWKKVEALPRNANGKVDRPALKAMFAAEQSEVGNAR